MSSSNWAEIPGGHGLGSIVSKLETTHHPALSLFFFFFFPRSETKLLPSVYQISSGLVRGSSDNPSQCFGQWAKVSRQECKERACGGMQEGNWVKNFISYNQASIFHQHYLIPKDPLIRHP